MQCALSVAVILSLAPAGSAWGICQEGSEK
jgi:hypothetical protein